MTARNPVRASLLNRLLPMAFLLALACLGRPSAAQSAGLDRNIMRVEFLYSIEHTGGRADRLREPMDLFFDRKKKELYIVDAATHKVFIYDNNGMFIQDIRLGGGEGAPTMVAVDGKGTIYTGHMGSAKITQLDYRGEPLDLLKLPGSIDAPGNNIRPLYLAGGKEGEIFVLKNSGGIVRIDPRNGSLDEMNIGGEGGPNMIYGMTVDSDGRFLFTDMRPYSVVAYDPRKKEFKRFGSPGVLYGQLDRPLGIAADEKGHIFVVSTVTNKVSCFDRDGNFIEEFGGLGDAYGRFYMPSKIVSDGKDRIYVLENTLKRVQVFRVEFLKEKGVMQGSSNLPREQG